MKKLLLTIISCLLLFSCNKTNTYDKEFQSDILKVASETIYLTNKANTKEISVTATNKFEATSNQDWLKVKVSSNKLILSASENSNYSDRMATVTVTSKDIKRKFDVIQYGQDLVLEVSQEQFNFAYTGGTESFTLTSNTNVDLQIDEPWLSVEKSENGSFNIVCKQNEVTQERVATIGLFVDGIKLRVLKVIQEQHPLPKFILPLSLFGQPTANVKKEEDKRKETKFLSDRDQGTGSIVDYEVTGEMFSKLTYYINLGNLIKCTLYGKENTFSQDEKNLFETFLKANDFKEIEGMGYENSLSMKKVSKKFFVNSKIQMKIEFMKDKIENYLCTYFPVQQKEYPTFTQFFNLPDNTWDLEKVKEYEGQNGGVYDSSQDKLNIGKDNNKYDLFTFNVSNNPDGLIVRKYSIRKDGQVKPKGLFAINYIYNDPTKSFYQGMDGNYYPTNEFNNFLMQNGFKFITYSSRTKQYKYINADKKVISCGVIAKSNEDPVLDIYIF